MHRSKHNRRKEIRRKREIRKEKKENKQKGKKKIHVIVHLFATYSTLGINIYHLPQIRSNIKMQQ